MASYNNFRTSLCTQLIIYLNYICLVKVQTAYIETNIQEVWGLPVSATRFLPNHTVQREDDTSASCLFFPKLNGVDIYHFMLGDNFGVKIQSFSAETGIPEDKMPKLILLFQSDHWTQKAYGSEILRNYSNVVIAGGYVDSLFTDSTFKLENQKK